VLELDVHPGAELLDVEAAPINPDRRRGGTTPLGLADPAGLRPVVLRITAASCGGHRGKERRVSWRVRLSGKPRLGVQRYHAFYDGETGRVVQFLFLRLFIPSREAPAGPSVLPPAA